MDICTLFAEKQGLKSLYPFLWENIVIFSNNDPLSQEIIGDVLEWPTY